MESLPKKRIKKSSAKEIDEQDNTEIDKNRVAPMPNLQYDILRIIFKFLKAKDLLQAACVCKSWNEAASGEIGSRMNPEYIFEKFYSMQDEIGEQGYGAYQLAIDLKIKPCFGIVIKKLNIEDEWSERDCFFHYLPANHNPQIVFSGYDIVADLTNVECKKNLAVALFLPNIPNLRINSYDFRYNFEISSIEFKKASGFLDHILSDSEVKNKCLIVLDTNINDVLKDIIERFEKRYKPGTIALWGGMTSSLRKCANKHYDPNMGSDICSTNMGSTLICLSSPSLQSWSIILPESCKSQAAMELRLKNFKEKIHLKKYSLALMCACVARLHKKKNEIQVFKKVFPGVTLVGFHGDGEYGLDSLSKKRQTITHTYSTVFLILTYE